MKGLSTVFILAVLLSACASISDVVPVGKDTYMISGWGKSPGGYSGAEVKTALFQEAGKYCTKQGKNIQVMSTNQSDMKFGSNATAAVQFMCLDSSDPEFTRPKITKEEGHDQ